MPPPHDARTPAGLGLGLGRQRASCQTCTSRHRSEWCGLDGVELNRLNQFKVCTTYQAGQAIFHQGHPCLGIYCVEAGTVALRKTDEHGNMVITRLVHAGDTLGYRAYFSGSAYSASAEALTATRVCFLQRDALRDLLSRNPTVTYAFLKHLARDLEEADTAKLHSASLPVRARLAHLLLILRDRFGEVQADGTLRIQLPLARQDIAAMLGARPETIARAVRALETDGVAHFDGRTVVVPDLDPLLDEMDAPV